MYYGTDKPIVIRTWKDNKLNKPDPKVYFKAMANNSLEYDPMENAKQLAKLFTTSLPGNTIDIFYEAIAECMLHLIDQELDFADKQHIENNVRIAINQLAEEN